MRACVECGQRLREPDKRHRCPHGHLCVGPSIHTVPTMLKIHGTSRADRELYCSRCCERYYEQKGVA